MNAHPPRLQEVLLFVGQLNYAWTNTESLLIHLIAGLARVDKETAVVVFLTLNTSKARIELVERLAKLQRTPVECRVAVLAATDRLKRHARQRNRYSHCIYAFDETGSHGSTQLMRIFDGKDEIHYGKIEELGPVQLRAIARTADEIAGTNRAIWDIVRDFDFPR
jgi:hypothetical protein